MKKKKLAVFGAVALLCGIAGVLFGLQRSAPEAAQPSAVSALLGRSMSDPHGRPQQLSQWKDKALLVNFWAPWCAPCVEEMPELSALQAEIASRGIQILGVGIDSQSNIAEFAAKYSVSYPLYVSGMDGTELSRQFGNQAGALPFTVLIGRDGQVRKTYLGRLKINELRQDLQAM